MASRANNPADVSTARGVKGGYMYIAPVGTKLPTDRKSPLDPAFMNAGYVSDEGWKESVDIDTTDAVTDERGDTVIASEASKYTEKLTFTLISMQKDSLAMQYGRNNVTDSDGEIVVDHNWGNAGDHWSVVLELLMKNDRHWRKVIADGNVTSLDEVGINKDDAVGREVELTYQNDANGSGCKDYIQSTETTAA